MDIKFERKSGISLIFGSVLIIATMVLHPSGGSIEKILKIYNLIVISHSMAILSLPFIAFGFYGLSHVLLTKSKLSMLSFIIICFGLVACMIAAAVNGLIVPMFLKNSSEAITQNIESVKIAMKLAFTINMAMDFIFIIAMLISIGIWSVLIIQSEKFPKWIGYFGILLILLAFIGAIFRFNFINLFGFRIFVFALASWIIGIGGIMAFRKEKDFS